LEKIKMFEEDRFENLLKSLRVRKGKAWTQAKTAKLLGISLRTYVGWENGESLPSNRDLKNIAATFDLNDANTEILFRAAGQVAPEIHNLPFPKNPLFTGRKSSLKKLDQLCPVPAIINTATRRGIGSNGHQTEELYAGVQTEGRAGKHAA
jgi:transcriptional regulator with XRE-family HTH domain